jgi:phosphoribosylamine--glycine ligase
MGVGGDGDEAIVARLQRSEQIDKDLHRSGLIGVAIAHATTTLLQSFGSGRGEAVVRFLGVGETCDLGALYAALQAEGHEVRVHVSEPLAQGTLAGMVAKVEDWRVELDWVRDGAILFESVSEGFGALQDELRAQGFNVIGGSAFGDRLENDRAYAQELLAGIGFPKGHVWRFDDLASALDFVRVKPARYVIKFTGADHSSADTYVGQMDDGADVAAMLRGRIAAGQGERGLILMAHIEGVEVGVGAFFNGQGFMTPACLDWEHKRFFAGDLGELTGEMGTVVTYERGRRLFERCLKPLEDEFRAAGHVGWVNLNTIVNEEGVWPLEFSCRFGYPGYAILAPLQAGGWGELLAAIVQRRPTHRAHPGFSVGVVMTTPPFPYSRHQVDEPVGLPVLIEPGVDPAHVHFGEVGLDAAAGLVTSGLYGWTLVVTGRGESIEAAKRQAYAHARQITVPNVRYRLDIGERLIQGDWARLEALDLLDPISKPALERLGIRR